MEIVTADGRIRRVRADSPSPDDDMFRAPCGGGGGDYGVVTALEYATEDIRGLTCARFMLTWPTTMTAAVLQGWTAWNADPATPRTVTCAFEHLSDSGMPALPTVTGTFIGTPADLEPVLDRCSSTATDSASGGGHHRAGRRTRPTGDRQALAREATERQAIRERLNERPEPGQPPAG